MNPTIEEMAKRLDAAEAERDEAVANLDRLHSWTGLMGLLDEHWPESIFPTLPDSTERDAGPRIISLIRWLDAETLRADRAEAAARTLGGIVEWQCRDIARIADAEHLVQDDGDADWGMIWDLAEERATRGAATEATVQRVREMHYPIEGVHPETVCAHRHCVDDMQDQCEWPCPTARAIEEVA